MTEAEWLTATDPLPMVEFAGTKMSQRKLRLFAVACCRRVSHLLVSDRSRTAIDVAERYADDHSTDEEMASYTPLQGSDFSLPQANQEAESAASQTCLGTQSFDASYSAYFACHHTRLAVFHYARIQKGRRDDTVGEVARKRMVAEQLGMFRDILGNPFRPLAADPRWLTSTAVGLAETIYSERAFDRLPILADALEEAGCDSADLLIHLRGDGPHVKGCWALDLVLGKG